MPIGVFCLASYVRSLGHETMAIDGEGQGLSSRSLARKAKAFAPDVVGVSSTTVAFHRALEVAREIRKMLPKAPLVLGGPHVTAATEDAMSHPEFDYAIIGEGETAFGDFLAQFQRARDMSSVDGLAFRENNQLKINPRGRFIHNLDDLPFPAYDLVEDLSLYNPPPCNYKKIPVVNIITSRGCPHACTFCDRSVFGRQLRQRSPENIAAEIQYLHNEYQVQEIAFVDDTFTINPKRIYSLFKILDKKGIHLPWTCMSRVDTIDRKTLEFMRDKGCWHISFGIESGNEDILKIIQKNISLKQARQAVKWCRELGILTKGFFMVGHPGETMETIEQSIQEALNMPLDDVVVTINTPMPGARQFQDAEQFGVIPNTDWSGFNMWTPVFIPKDLTSDQLVNMHKKFYRKFYLRPRPLFRYALSFLSADGVKRIPSMIRSLPYLLGGRK